MGVPSVGRGGRVDSGRVSGRVKRVVPFEEVVLVEDGDKFGYLLVNGFWCGFCHGWGFCLCIMLVKV
jgi:hypothetical protein